MPVARVFGFPVSLPRISSADKSVVARCLAGAGPGSGRHWPAVTDFEVELLLSAIEDVFEMNREDLFGAGKNSRIITAKEVFILTGKESGASIIELSKFVGIDQ